MSETQETYTQKAYVYMMVSRTRGWYKIGISENLHKRRNELMGKASGLDKIDIVDAIPSVDCKSLEEAFHRVFRKNGVTEAEWGDVEIDCQDPTALGKKEWFKLDEEHENLFRALAKSTGVSETHEVLNRLVEKQAGLLNLYDSTTRTYLHNWDVCCKDRDAYRARNEKLRTDNEKLRAALKAMVEVLEPVAPDLLERARKFFKEEPT